MSPILHLREDSPLLQRPGKGEAVLHLQGEAARVQGETVFQAGKGLPELKDPAGCPAVLPPAFPQQPVPGQVHRGQNGVRGAGGAEDRGHLPHPVQLEAVVKKQGGLPHGGEGLVGGDSHHIRLPKGGQPQEGQVSSMGSVHKKFSTMGVDNPGNGSDI